MVWKIEKHYFDLQTEDGQCFIGYRGLWGPSWLRWPYGAWLWKLPGQEAVFRQSLRAGKLAVETAARSPINPFADAKGSEHSGQPENAPERPLRATWTHQTLGLSGSWTGRGDGPRLRLETDQGYIDWQVSGAASPAQVSLKKRTLSGIGYWERVELSIPPWRLPFPELRWGRFLADEEGFYLVWVAWLGGQTEEKRLWSPEGELSGLAFEDGDGPTELNEKSERSLAAPRARLRPAAEMGLLCDSGRLEFKASEVLRQGPLFKTLGGPLAIGARLLPGGLGRAYESKWFSRARWRAADGRDIPGWALHEKVSWR